MTLSGSRSISKRAWLRLMADDYMMLCHGCWVELIELRRMVLEKLPRVDDEFVGAYVAVNARDLRRLKSFAEDVTIGHASDDDH